MPIKKTNEYSVNSKPHQKPLAKRPFSKGIAIVLLSFALQQCSSSLLVKTDYDQDADFSQYKTFAFYQYEDKQAEINELNKRRIHSAIEEELA